MNETTSKREPWPTGLFDCCSGGTSLCLWGFLCPICLDLQGYRSSQDQPDYLATQSQFERYPPWSCRGIVDHSESILLFFLSCCCCLYGLFAAWERHGISFDRANFEYYCSSQKCCFCDDVSIEDCLIGYCCYCCSVIQVAMAIEEHFRMKSKVEGDVNIKRAR